MIAAFIIGIAAVLTVALPVLFALDAWQKHRLRRRLEQDIHWAGVEASWREYIDGWPVLDGEWAP